MAAMIGARWDEPCQDERTRKAADRELITYIEVNYPIPYRADPLGLGIPILAHTSSNPVCSAFGINTAVAKQVREGANAADSPWIGEHISWLGAAASGSLGYQINPLFTGEFAQITVMNVRRLREFYARPVALELGPIYLAATEYESEMHFLGQVAADADAMVILDVTHWQIGNRNLERPPDYGLDAIEPERIVELHVAGMRQGSDRRFWHDAHEVPPSEEVLEITVHLAKTLPALRAITFEHHAAAPEGDFFRSLERLNEALAPARAA